MTTMQISLSETLAGIWTPLASDFGYTHRSGLASPAGVPQTAVSSQPNQHVHSPSFQLPDAPVAGSYDEDTFTALAFGGSQLAIAANNPATANGLVKVRAFQTPQTKIFTPGWYRMADGAETNQIILSTAPWNVIKAVAVSALSARALTVSNFVDVAVDTGDDTAAHTIDIEGAKRGSITATGGDETVEIAFRSNEYTWSNTFDVKLGNGANNVFFQPDYTVYYGAAAVLTPMQFNTAPQKSRLDLTVGDGANMIDIREGSASIHLGDGTDQVSFTDGNNEIWLGRGADTVTINPHNPAFVFAMDLGADTVHLGVGTAVLRLGANAAFAQAPTTIEVPQLDATSAASKTTVALFATGGVQPTD